MSRNELLLAIDIGSSSCKAATFSLRGECIACAKSDVAAISTEEAAGRREYDPDDWLRAIELCSRTLASVGGDLHGRIAAIGLSGQIGTHIIVSPAGRPVYPAISWQDGRAKDEALKLAQRYPGFMLDEYLGMHLPPGTAWPIPRLLWVKNNEPLLLHAGNKWIQPKDYLLKYLTGELATDRLSLRGLVDPKARSLNPTVSGDILGWPSIEEYLPETKEAWEIGGRLRGEAAEALGLDPAIPVVVGAGDFHCAVLGSGELPASDGFNVTGTSDHIGVLVTAENVSARSEVLGRYPSLIEGKDILYGATSSSGGMLEWLASILGGRGKGEAFGEYLGRELRGEKTSKGIVCLPYLNGERAPLWDSDARAAFIGMGTGHTRAEMLLSVLEGVALSLRNNVEIIRSLGLSITRFRVSGASALSRQWNQIKADALKSEVSLLKSREVSCLGAAMLAAVGLGCYEDTRAASSAMSREAAIVEPDASMYEYYDRLFESFKKEYEANREVYSDLTKIRGMQ